MDLIRDCLLIFSKYSRRCGQMGAYGSHVGRTSPLPSHFIYFSGVEAGLHPEHDAPSLITGFFALLPGETRN